MKALTYPYFFLITTVALMAPVANNHTKEDISIGQYADADMQIIKKRILDDLLEPSINVEQVKQLMQTIQPDGSWPGINYKDVSRTGFENRIHLENMVELSRAYRKTGSPFYKDAALKKVIASALGFWLQHDFICENWWWNEMGTPGLMINTLLLMDTDLTNEEKEKGLRIAHRANLENSGSRPGGDLIVIAGILGKQALFLDNPDTLNKVIKVMASEIKITTEKRGLQPDMSFHHRVDNVISTLSYGTNYVSAFAYWALKTTGTKYSLPQEAMKLLIDYYLDGICASMVYGKYPDPGAKNRDLSRRGTLEAVGPGLAENLLQSSSYRSKELQDIIAIRKGEKAPSLSAAHFFWHSEYFTHQRPDYFASVRMHSSRNYTMEQPYNEEGLKNHHYGDGSSFISITGKEYVDVFPVWDWMKIPGTTIIQKPALPHWNEIAKKGLTDFVGGVTDGRYGAAAFDFASPHDPVKARKAWFFFDKEYVCLGAGINASTGYPVATTLNQCLLNGDVTAKAGNVRIRIAKGKSLLNKVSWVLHNNVAYVFPSPVQAHIDDSTATGTWRSITHQAWATEEPVKKDIFCLWLDHGSQPVNAQYSYIVVPHANATTADNYSKKSPVIILSNTPEIQAVQNKVLNIFEAVFYKAGNITLSKSLILTVDNPCLMMVTMKGNNIQKITVSDPTEKLQALQCTVTSRFQGSGKNWKSAWHDGKKASVIEINLPTEGYAGQSVVIAP